MSAIIAFKTDSHYKVNRKKIRQALVKLLIEKNVRGEVFLSVVFCGDRMVKSLNCKYRGVDKTTDVLSFPLYDEEGKLPFHASPDGILRLGDIVISYPQAVLEAMEDETMVDDKLIELACHGLLHLLGIHHD